MKIALWNFVFSCITAVGWALVIILSLLSIPIQIISILTGLAIILLLASNLVGSIAGIALIINDIKSQLAWGGFVSHGIQLLTTTSIIALGVVIS